ncbi:MAG UNVERIFIED_CONTAM: hypothetical protein LVR29_02660 [Microcystis novacekii LVE1205-3]
MTPPHPENSHPLLGIIDRRKNFMSKFVFVTGGVVSEYWERNCRCQFGKIVKSRDYSV